MTTHYIKQPILRHSWCFLSECDCDNVLVKWNFARIAPASKLFMKKAHSKKVILRKVITEATDVLRACGRVRWLRIANLNTQSRNPIKIGAYLAEWKRIRS